MHLESLFDILNYMVSQYEIFQKQLEIRLRSELEGEREAADSRLCSFACSLPYTAPQIPKGAYATYRDLLKWVEN